MKQISLGGTTLEHFHVCAFFNSRDEEYEVLTPFFKEGIDQGEKVFHIVNPANLDDHHTRLEHAGIDTGKCKACGQLEVVPWQNAYLDESGTFNKERMLETVDKVTKGGLAEGYSGMRIMGDMEWVFSGAPGSDEILEYEAAVNDVLLRNSQPAVCVYDIAKLSGSMMMDLLRTHPLTLIGGVIQENPFYTPAAQMLAELQARRASANQAAAE